jgi:hypothetical protein
LTNNERTEFGGRTFGSCLKRISDPSQSPNKRLVTVTRSEVKQNTRIFPNIPIIKNFLDKKNIVNTYFGRNVVTMVRM